MNNCIQHTLWGALIRFSLIALCAASITSQSHADELLQRNINSDAEFLGVDNAFQVRIEPHTDGSGADIVWTIAPTYYLYKHKFKVKIPVNANNSNETDLLMDVELSKGLRKTDDYYGQVEVYYYQAIATLNRANWQQVIAANNDNPTIEVSYQGCAEAGLCYPAQTRRLSVQTNIVKKIIE